MTATIGILNVGAGDTKLSFDPTNPAECIRAARIVKDMLRRGYALLIDSGRKDDQGRPIHVRALDFDEKTHEYIIADFDPTVSENTNGSVQASQTKEPAGSGPAPTEEGNPGAHQGSAGPTGDAKRTGLDDGVPLVKPKRGRPPNKRIAAAAASGIAVSRTAGG